MRWMITPNRFDFIDILSTTIYNTLNLGTFVINGRIALLVTGRVGILSLARQSIRNRIDRPSQ